MKADAVERDEQQMPWLFDITATEIGETFIISQLSLIVSTQYTMATVTCGNNGHKMTENNSIIFCDYIL